jgi:hypothetical protein
MSYYSTEMLARSRQAELLNEANHAHLAKLAQQHQRASHPSRLAIGVALKQLAAAASTLLR